jgi:hypothetical protein
MKRHNKFGCAPVPGTVFVPDSSKSLPAISEVEDAQRILGFKSRKAIFHLVKVRLLPTLGKPKKRRWKRFATADLLKLREDSEWLQRAQQAIDKMWDEINAAKRPRKNVWSG